jgi:hypothetical protein
MQIKKSPSAVDMLALPLNGDAAGGMLRRAAYIEILHGSYHCRDRELFYGALAPTGTELVTQIGIASQQAQGVG